MNLNVLKFKTDTGIPLIFDNYSGIVIHENNYTESILKNINEDKKTIRSKLKINTDTDIDEFEKEYMYINNLVNAGYFNYNFFEKFQNDKPR